MDDPADVAAPGSDDVVTLAGWLASVSRRGAWRVPKVLRLRRRGGSTKLDLTEADIRHDRVRLEVDVIGGSIEIRVPADTDVDLDGLSVSLGSAEDHRPRKDRPGVATASGALRIDVVGDLRWGSLEVRGPQRHPLLHRRT